MIIIVGLGNPGEKFKNTRHNVGFMAVDAFAEKNNFPEFKLSRFNRGSSTKSGQKKPARNASHSDAGGSNALVSEGILEGETVILAKPQTFMNESGKAVKSLMSSFKSKSPNLVVIHDDIDIPVGKIKIVEERGSAGHKGVESIIKSVGNEGLVRFRIGIAGKNDVEAMKVVLKKFSTEEQKTISETIQKVADALDVFIKEGLAAAQNYKQI